MRLLHFFKKGGNTVKTLTNTTRGYWCAALGGVIWGLSGVAGQFLLSVYDASPFWLTGVRMTCAGIVFLILSLRQTRSLGIVVRHPKELITIFVYGIFGLMLNQLSYFFSISYSNAGTATVLQTLCVVMMAVLVCLQRSRLPYGREILSVILAFIGVVLIATHGRITELVLSPQALIWGLLDAASCVVYTLLSINPVRKWGSVVVNAIGMLTGGIFLSLLYRPWEVMPHLDLAGWLAFFGIVLFGTVLTYVLFLQGVKDIGPLNTTLIATVEPVSSALCSALLLGTVFTFAEIVGLVLIIATVFLIVAQKKVTG